MLKSYIGPVPLMVSVPSLVSFQVRFCPHVPLDTVDVFVVVAFDFTSTSKLVYLPLYATVIFCVPAVESFVGVNDTPLLTKSNSIISLLPSLYFASITRPYTLSVSTTV